MAAIGDWKMDFGEAIGASLRDVRSGERDGSMTHIVRVSRKYFTTPADLWSALTDNERLPRWFAKVSGTFSEGGRFSIEGNADGEIVACKPPERLALTWEFAGNVSWVTVTIKKAGDGALLTVEHEIPTDTKSEAHWDQYGPGATGVGWELAMMGLDLHVSGGGTSIIDAGETWAGSAQGKETLRGWAEAWGEAHMNAGADTQAAMVSAERTAAFYTGAEE